MRSSFILWAILIAAVFGGVAIFVPEGIGSTIMLAGLSLILLPVLRNYSSEPDLSFAFSSDIRSESAFGSVFR